MSFPVLRSIVVAIGTGGQRLLTKSANDPSPQLHRSDTERRQTECPVKRIAPCSPRPRYPSRHRLGEGGSEPSSTGFRPNRYGPAVARRRTSARPTLTDKIACNRRYPIYSVGNKALGPSALMEYDPVTLPTETNSAPPMASAKKSKHPLRTVPTSFPSKTAKVFPLLLSLTLGATFYC